MTNITNRVSFQYKYRPRVSWLMRKRKQLRCALTILAVGRRIISDNSQRTQPAFRVQTLKLNTLAINLAFMRLSRGIEGSDGRYAESVGTSGERMRERGERVKIVYMHLYLSFRGEGCPVAMVTRWLIGRTTDAGRRWFIGGLGEKSFEGFLAAWSIIPRDGRGRLWSVQWPWQCPITSGKLHHNARGAVLSFPFFSQPSALL